MLYLFEQTRNGSFIDVYEVEPQDISIFSYQIEREGNTSFSCSKDYVRTLRSKVLEHFASLDAIYEDALLAFLGERDWGILKYTEEACFAATLNGRKLYVL